LKDSSKAVSKLRLYCNLYPYGSWHVISVSTISLTL